MDGTQWTSYFKGGVVGFDKQENRYFVLYVPNDKYAWISELRLAGQYLYMKAANPDGSGHSWTVRIRRSSEANKEVFVLERGAFDMLVQPSVDAATAASPAQSAADANDSHAQQPSQTLNGRVLLFIILAVAAAGIWWVRQQRARPVAIASGEKEKTDMPRKTSSPTPRQPRFCTVCGAKFSGMRRFCTQCGTAVDAPWTAAASSAPQVVAAALGPVPADSELPETHIDTSLEVD